MMSKPNCPRPVALVITSAAPPARPARSRSGLSTVLALRGLLGVLGVAMALSAQALQQTRTSAFEYDPTSGLLVKEIVEPGNSELCVVTTYRYDGFGNRTSSTTRNCNGSAGSHPGVNSEAAAPAAGNVALFASRTSSNIYTADGRFVATSTNSLDHSDTKAYDPRFGAVTRLTGPNGLTTEWRYDGLGRKIWERRADGTGTKWDYLYCSGTNGGTATCPSNIKGPANAVGTGIGVSGAYVIVTTPVRGLALNPDITVTTATYSAVNGPVSKVYYDALNRGIRAETEGFDPNGTSTAIYKDTVYDSLGQVAYVSRPYYANTTPVWARSAYDSLGRVVTIESQDDDGAPVTLTYSYNGLSTTTTNSKNQTETKTSNSQGQLVSVTDANAKVLNYLYDPFGNLLSTSVQGLESITTSAMLYDLRGRKRLMVDPDMGSWTYEYNALGELLKQTDAKSQVTTMVYDKLGRMTQRKEPDLVTNWYYDTKSDGSTCGSTAKGKLCQAISSNGYNRSHIYDNLGRLWISTNTIDGTTYGTISGYESGTGRVLTQTYPTGLTTKFVYTARGYLKELRNNDASNSLYWRADSMDASGQLTSQTFGNNVQTTQVFNTYTGRLMQIRAGANNGVLNLSYTYDSIGNLSNRQDVNQSLNEALGYDNLNRLKTSTLNANTTGFVQTTYAYDILGNLTCKSDLGACSDTSANLVYGGKAYNSAGQAVRSLPHAVNNLIGSLHGATNPTYQYDLNGNLTSGAGFSLVYTSYNMVSRITHPSKDGVAYLYGAEHQRIREQILTPASPTVKETTVYLHPDMANGLFYEKVQASGATKHKHYLTAGGQVFAVIEQTVTGSTTTTAVRYLHRDHLGSVSAVTSEAAVVLERMAYDAWGKRRYPSGAVDSNDQLKGLYSDRGYTNHEHVEALGLINMNGRFYDPALGRFFSADPFIEFPDNLQSYNRYSYVWNNPLTYTDQNGYCIFGCFWHGKNLKKLIKPIIAIALTYVTGGTCSFCLNFASVAGSSAFWTPIVNGAAGGFVGGLVASNGNLTAALKGGISGALFGYAGLQGSYPDDLLRYAAHAGAGCVSGLLQGGGCGRGLASAVVGKYITNQTQSWSDDLEFARFAASTMGGGVTSVIAGGKFENGALTAAYGYLFNHLTAKYVKSTGVLTVTDDDTGKTVTANFKSGDSFFYGLVKYDSVPVGTYDLLEQGRRDDFFRLEPRDAFYGDDRHDSSGMTELRLHKPGVSQGCITACDASGWSAVKQMFLSTQTSFSEVYSKGILARTLGMQLSRELVKNYGKLTVVDK